VNDPIERLANRGAPPDTLSLEEMRRVTSAPDVVSLEEMVLAQRPPSPTIDFPEFAPDWVRAGIEKTSWMLAYDIASGRRPKHFSDMNFLEKIGSEVLSFVIDPLTYLTFGLGGKAAATGVARFVMKRTAQKMVKEGAEKVATVGLLRSKIPSAIAGGAVGLGTFSAVKDPLAVAAEGMEVPWTLPFVAGAKGAALGALAATAGGVAGKPLIKRAEMVEGAPRIISHPARAYVETAAEIGAFGAASPSIQKGELVMPTVEDFANAAGVILGIRAVKGLPELVGSGLRKLAIGADPTLKELKALKYIDPDARNDILEKALEDKELPAPEAVRPDIMAKAEERFQELERLDDLRKKELERKAEFEQLGKVEYKKSLFDPERKASATEAEAEVLNSVFKQPDRPETGWNRKKFVQSYWNVYERDARKLHGLYVARKLGIEPKRRSLISDLHKVFRNYKERWPKALDGVTLKVTSKPLGKGMEEWLAYYDTTTREIVISTHQIFTQHKHADASVAFHTLRHEIEHAFDWGLAPVQAREAKKAGRHFIHHEMDEFALKLLHKALVKDAILSSKVEDLYDTWKEDYPNLAKKYKEYVEGGKPAPPHVLGRIAQIEQAMKVIRKGGIAADQTRIRSLHSEIGLMLSEIKPDRAERHKFYKNVTGVEGVNDMSVAQLRLLYEKVAELGLDPEVIIARNNQIQDDYRYLKKSPEWSEEMEKEILEPFGLEKFNDWKGMLGIDKDALVAHIRNIRMKHDQLMQVMDALSTYDVEEPLPPGAVRSKRSVIPPDLITLIREKEMNPITIGLKLAKGNEDSPLYKFIVDPMIKGDRAKEDVMQEFRKAEEAAIPFGKIPWRTFRKWQRQVVSVELPEATEQYDPVTGRIVPVKKLNVTHSFLAHLRAVVSDIRNREEIVNGKGLFFKSKLYESGGYVKVTDKHIDFLIEQMPRELKDWVDASVKLFNEIVTPKVLVELKKIGKPWAEEARAIIQENWERGLVYYPGRRDMAEITSDVGEILNDFIKRRFIKEGRTERLKPRKSSDAPFVIDDFFEVHDLYKRQLATFIGAHERAGRINTILSDPQFKGAIKARFTRGSQLLNELNEVLIDFKGLVWEAPGAFDRTVRGLVRRSHPALLGMKMHIPLLQLPSLFLATTEIPAKYILSALSKPGEIKKALPEATENSNILKGRYDRGGALILTPHRDLANTVDKWYRGKYARFSERILLGGIRNFDRFVITTIWTAAKMMYEGQGLKGKELLEATARKTEDVIMKTQPDWRLPTLTGLARGARKDILLRLLTLFSSQRGQNLQVIMRAWQRYRESDGGVQASKSMLKNIGTVVLTQAMVHAIRAAFLFGVYKGFKPQKEEMDVVDHAWGIFETTMSSWVGVGDILSTMASIVLREKPERRQLRPTVISSLLTDMGEALGHFRNMIDAMPMSDEIIEYGKYKGMKRSTVEMYNGMEKAAKAIGMLTGKPIPGIIQMTGEFWLPSRKAKSLTYYYDMYWNGRKAHNTRMTRYARKMVGEMAGYKGIQRLYANYENRRKKERERR